MRGMKITSETAQEALKPGQIKASGITTKDCLCLVSAAFMYFSLHNKMEERRRDGQAMPVDEIQMYERYRNWWTNLGWDHRQTIYEIGGRFAYGFAEATEILG